MHPEVNILLSTYNGAAYLSEQLDSLLGQDYHNLIISVRDDESTDETCEILADYASRSRNIDLKCGNHKGIVPSYFSLLKSSKSDSAYYAFCDQDDVWYPGKLSRAVARLEGIASEIPAIYFSRLEYVSKDLSHLAFSRSPVKPLSFENALVENMATGCTVVMNKTARNTVVECLPQWCVMHDWWCYLLVSALGVVVYDDQPQIKYRLHGENQTGASYLLQHRILGRLKRFIKLDAGAFQAHAQALELMSRIGGRMPESKRAVLRRFIDSKNGTFFRRARFAFGGELRRQAAMDDVMLRLLILMGRY